MLSKTSPLLCLFKIRLYFAAMGIYGFLKLGAAPLAMAILILCQLFIKKKKFAEIKGDFFAALFFVGINLLIFYWITV